MYGTRNKQQHAQRRDKFTSWEAGMLSQLLRSILRTALIKLQNVLQFM